MGNSMRTSLLLLLAAAMIMVTVMVTGCVGPKAVPVADGLKPSASKVVVIGKVVLDPPFMAEYEQQTYFHMIGDEQIVGRVYVATGPAKPISHELTMKEWQKSIVAQWDEPFMVEMERKRTWVRGAMTFLDAASQERLLFPGGVHFDVPEGTSAIYVGTLRYQRDDFNTITKMEVIDEYEDTLQALGLAADRQQVAVSLLKFGR